MSNISRNIIARASKVNFPTVFVEKSSLNTNGSYAKVLFRLAATPKKSKEFIKNHEELAAAFDAKLEGSARLITSSIHSSGVEGLYCGYIKLNTPRVTVSEATKSGFMAVSANMFSDPDDNIWVVEELSDGEKILVRTANEDLQEILRTRTSPTTMATAAAGYSLNGSYTQGVVVAFFDGEDECIRKGVAVDNGYIFDFDTTKFHKASACDVVATAGTLEDVATHLNTLYPDTNTTFEEVAADYPRVRSSIRAYLTQLYGHNKAYLDQYLSAIDALLGA